MTTPWTPKGGSTTLDNISADYLPAFRYQLLRNGHVVGMFISLTEAERRLTERVQALPVDTWTIHDRQS